MTPVQTSSSRPSAFMSLLARYVTGQITDSQWQRLTGILDAQGVSIGERMAFARFVNEAMTEQPTWSPDQTVGDEMTGLLTELRASRAA